MATLVTALILQSDGRVSHKITEYFESFRKIANTGISIILFLDEALNIDSMPNVTVVKTKINDLPLFKEIDRSTAKFDVGDNPEKNTLDYLIIQNSKTWFMNESLKYTDEGRIAWIDFGACHMMKTSSETLEKLHLLDLLEGGTIIPGCWPVKTSHLYPISWRFAGTFLTVERKDVPDLFKQHMAMIGELRPHISWEVNIWARMETLKGVKFKWYKADHDDTILNFDPYLTMDPSLASPL